LQLAHCWMLWPFALRRVEHCWAKSRVEPLRIIHDVYASWDNAHYWEIMGSFLCVLGGVQGILELGLPLILVGASEKQSWKMLKHVETGYPGL
jgi:hypothetical protein